MNRNPARRKALPFVISALALASCRSGGIGSAPRSLVELYDVADPRGKIELELDRDGGVREMESEIPIADLPPEVRAAALAEAPGGLIVGAERELQDAGWLWEVQLWHDGRDWELVLDDGGRVRETEKKLHRHEWPQQIVASADHALPGGIVKSVELVEHDGRAPAYHVKKEIDGASYKLILAADGQVQRKVREQRAEIEIPLAD